MSEGAHFELESGEGDADRLVLSGAYLVSTIGYVDDDLKAISHHVGMIDLAQVAEIDTAGAWLASSLARSYGAQITGASERAQRLIAAVSLGEEAADIGAPRGNWLRTIPGELGRVISEFFVSLADIIGFLGQVLLGFFNVIRRPRLSGWTALVRQMELVGVSALPIIGLMSFLIGIVIAQQGAVQLEQFGAETLTVNLVGRITLRELGVLMTAIMVAGRSGSAFAAQIGTMKLTEEVDAMRTIGLSPIETLVIPRILASTFMMVVLGFFSSVMAIVGGAVISDYTLGIPFFTFIDRVKDVVPTYDLYVGLIKAPVFGLIVGLAGCYQGMKVSGNSEEVGLRTTKAVVQAIFAVIVLDAFFAVFFTEIGWG